ncbi:MAG: hypothetical protein ACOC7U_04015 [Spirochaetota bacterium]
MEKALREDSNMERLPMRLFEHALKETRPSVTPEMEDEYKRIAEKLKTESVRTRRKTGFAVPGEE